MENFLTTKQVQNLFKVDRITVYRMLQDGRLKGIKIGNQWRFSQSEVERMLNGISLPDEPESDSSFPVHCVQTIQNLFSSVSKTNALVINQNGEPVTTVSKQSRFCKLIQSSETGLNACQASWKSFISQKSNQDQMFICHAGLKYFGALIINQNVTQGMFLSGQFLDQAVDFQQMNENCQKLARKHNLDPKDLLGALGEIPTFSEGQKAHLVDQPQAAASAVESILVERSAFLDRLQKIANLTQNL
ncbi:MAG: helix-turn-helix domain-containing protein [Anaerolineaceae bacterium]|nr:helix-turn-helix domain-containing protein [Anaerolineaceae bacterium]